MSGLTGTAGGVAGNVTAIAGADQAGHEAIGVLQAAPDAAMSFAAASQVVLDYLVAHVPLGYWAITRVADGRQSYLSLGDNVYDLQRGGSHAWQDSFCRYMADGTAPSVAPDAQSVPVYAAAGVNASLQIGAYAGAPIHDSDGSLFGAICGLDPKVAGPELVDHKAVIDVLAQLLEIVLVVDRAREHAVQVAQSAHADGVSDELTGVLNQRGWELLLAAEEEHLQVFGDPAAVVVATLSDSTDSTDSTNPTDPTAISEPDERALVTLAWCLSTACAPDAAVARIGRRQFAIVVRPATAADARDFVGSVKRELATAGLRAALAWAPVTLAGGYDAALRSACADLDAACG
ncbi:MAG: hypothetical protein ACTHMW_14950 [Actinomycetes bacterium]